MTSQTSKTPEDIQKFIFEYSLFLIIAARGAVDEPRLYGSFRLVDAISKLTELYSMTDLIEKDQFLLKVASEIERSRNRSDDDFIRFMDDLVSEFVDEMKKRYQPSSHFGNS